MNSYMVYIEAWCMWKERGRARPYFSGNINFRTSKFSPKPIDKSKEISRGAYFEKIKGQNLHASTTV